MEQTLAGGSHWVPAFHGPQVHGTVQAIAWSHCMEQGGSLFAGTGIRLATLQMGCTSGTGILET